MSIELWSIAVMPLLLMIVTIFQGAQTPLTQGLQWGLGSRDEPLEQSALQGRFSRTVQNQVEAMLMYVPLMALVVGLDLTNEWTAIAAWLVIVGRITFVPLYLLGVFALRSVAYSISMIGIFMTAWTLIV